MVVALLLVFGSAVISFAGPRAGDNTGTARITVIYDAFGKSPGMQQD